MHLLVYELSFYVYKEKHFYFQRHYIITNATLECGNGSF